jgi:hypothetical protein
MKPSRFMAAFVAAFMFTLGSAQAHNDPTPNHGGVVQMDGEIKFELVTRNEGAELYLSDHGAAMPTAKLAGKLTVMSGSARTETKLEPMAGGKFIARGVKLAKGDKVIANVALEDKLTTSVRFVIK